jgi:type VI secretion system protein ImpL
MKAAVLHAVRGRPLLLALWIARALLALWAAGLVVAAVELDDWRRELARTLVQLNADAQFRARAPAREAVDPEWYRRKALSLLAATGRLQRDTSWTLFVPGSWRVFDKLEERLRARVEHEFAEIVVETIHVELYRRAGELTGMPLVGRAAAAGAADCQSPLPRSIDRRPAAADELPEFVAARDHVDALAQLDAAVQAFLNLQHSAGEPGTLRDLVRYTLHADLPGSLDAGVRLFQAPGEVNLRPAWMQASLQAATRCSLRKAMAALHTRLLDANDLLALEQGLAGRLDAAFGPAARAMPAERTIESLRAAHALLRDQQALLARGGNDWMREGQLRLGPAYEAMLRKIAQTRLLGPEVLAQIGGESNAAFAEFRRAFDAAYGGGEEAGIVWRTDKGGFAFSGQRAALHDALDAMLRLPFIADPVPARASGAARPDALATAVHDARSIAQERRAFSEEMLPKLAAPARIVVARLVNSRAADAIYQGAYRAMKTTLPRDAATPLDPASFTRLREQVAVLQPILKDAGAPLLGERLHALLDSELLARLAVLEDDWRRQPMLNDARAADLGWWQGEAIAPATLLGAADNASFSAAAARLDTLRQQARSLVALGSPALAADVHAQQWERLALEVDRYRARRSDSSLLRLEHFTRTLGSDLRKENCAERLAQAGAQPSADDPIAVRHAQVREALQDRCNELRAGGPAPAGVQ